MTTAWRTVRSLFVEPDWYADAACQGKGAHIFYPDGKGPAVNNDAYTICDGCQVKPECLAYALENEPDGVWGGLSERARQKMGGITQRPRAVA